MAPRPIQTQVKSSVGDGPADGQGAVAADEGLRRAKSRCDGPGIVPGLVQQTPLEGHRIPRQGEPTICKSHPPNRSKQVVCAGLAHNPLKAQQLPIARGGAAPVFRSAPVGIGSTTVPLAQPVCGDRNRAAHRQVGGVPDQPDGQHRQDHTAESPGITRRTEQRKGIPRCQGAGADVCNNQ